MQSRDMPRDCKRARQEATTDEPDDNFVRLLIEEARQNESRRKIEGVNAFITRKANPNGLKPNTNFLSRVVKNVDFHNTALLKKEAEDAAARLMKLNQIDAPRRPACKSRLRDIRKRGPTGDSHQDADGSSKSRRQTVTDTRMNSSQSSDGADCSSATFSCHDPERVSRWDSDGESQRHHPRRREYNKHRTRISVDTESYEGRDLDQCDGEHHVSRHREHSREESASKQYSQEALQQPSIETRKRQRTR
ncbi:hypothetical protein V1525DRAFT_141565 [Lipomyces kononenkoae]|uniref:Uncharacterized protein n=1 Tax=Lipomyces kononenkoae TaxID=34357 RepID=A0ACC3TAT1_LIPKO